MAISNKYQQMRIRKKSCNVNITHVSKVSLTSRMRRVNECVCEWLKVELRPCDIQQAQFQVSGERKKDYDTIVADGTKCRHWKPTEPCWRRIDYLCDPTIAPVFDRAFGTVLQTTIWNTVPVIDTDKDWH